MPFGDEADVFDYAVEGVEVNPTAELGMGSYISHLWQGHKTCGQRS